MGNQPTIDLNVSLSEFWPGFQTVLVDVAPSYIVTNSCDLDLVFMGTEDVQYDLRKGHTICPPKLEVRCSLDFSCMIAYARVEFKRLLSASILKALYILLLSPYN